MNIPYNIELEQSLLAALLHYNKCLDQIDFLHEKHFYNPLHTKIFKTIKAFYYSDKIATPITIGHFFQNQGEEDHKEYLIQIIDAFISTAYAEKWAEQIYDLYLRRELLIIIDKYIHEVNDFEKYDNTKQYIEQLDGDIYKLMCDQETFKDFEEFGIAAEKTIMNLKNNNRKVGIHSGFTDLDKLLGGLHRSDLMILAGRPSMGKTALGTNIAFNIAKSDKRTLFFSLEMSTDQLVTRILSQEASIPANTIRQGKISNSDIAKFINVAKQIKNIPLFIEDSANIDIMTLCTKVKRMHKKSNVDLVVIDYLQLLTSKRSENRMQELSEITRQLKALAKSIDAPILALSQLSRAVETRDDKKPQLSDLRESGSIEQDADIVMFIYREEYYLSRKGIINPDVENKAELMIAKQRHGPIGNIILHFDSKYTKFSNIEIQNNDHFF